MRAGDGAEESRVELKVELSLCGVSSAAALDLRGAMVWMDVVDVRRVVQTGTAGRSDRVMYTRPPVQKLLCCRYDAAVTIVDLGWM